LQRDINQSLEFFNQGVQKGEEHVLRWIPGGTLEVYINGKKVGTIQNEAFVKSLWDLWFGPKSVVDRDQLISQWK
jgi:hypothetical protein